MKVGGGIWNEDDLVDDGKLRINGCNSLPKFDRPVVLKGDLLPDGDTRQGRCNDAGQEW